MRALALALLLALPAAADTELRQVLNDSDGPVRLEVADWSLEVPRFEQNGEVRVRLPVDSGMKIQTRDGVWFLADREGKLVAWKEGGEPLAISNRSGEYITLWIDPNGRMRVRRWPYSYLR